MPPSDRLLVADIGGTRARFAQVVDGQIGTIVEHPVSRYDSALAAVRGFIAEHELSPRRAALAVAGPVIDGYAELTNANWRFDEVALQRDLGLDSVLLLNDFEAIAHALPALPPEALQRIGGGEAVAGAPRAVVGPGTGLGVAGLLTLGDRSLVVHSEGGHASMAAGGPDEVPLLEALRARFGHVSAERVLSGDGLVNLYRESALLAGRTALELRPSEVSERALAGEDPDCEEALRHFCAMLGSVAGDLALMFCARGGVFIAGGILPRMLPFFLNSRFRQCFEAKGRFRDYLGEIPVWVITEPHPAFQGLIAADRQKGIIAV